MPSHAAPPAWPSTLASSRRILADLWLRHRNQGTLWLGGLLVLVCVAFSGIPLGLAAMTGSALPPLLLPVVASVSAGMLLTTGWLLTVGSVLEQNHPVLARTVPGHVRRLRGALLLGAGAVLAAVAAIAGAVAALAPAASAPVVVMAAVAGGALVLTYAALAMRWPVLWMAMWVAPAFLGSALADPRTARMAADAAAVVLAPPVLAAATVVIVAACAWLVHGLVQAGGVAHERRYAALRARTARTHKGAARGLEQFLSDGLLCRLSALRDRLYAAATRRRLARGGASPAARAMLAFGPAAHWTAQAGAIAGVGATILVLAALLARMPASTPLGGLVTGFSVSLVFTCSRSALNARAWLHATRGEQALVMLAPGVPRGGALNRAIGRRLAVQFLAGWAIGLAGVALMPLLLRHTVAFGAPGASGSWPQFAMMLALAQLLLLPSMWRPWHRTPPATPATIFVLVLATSLAALAALALAHAGVLPIGGAGAALAAAAIVLAGRRWRRMRAEPSMLPVGRLRA
jgi:hypothetical protein